MRRPTTIVVAAAFAGIVVGVSGAGGLANEGASAADPGRHSFMNERSKRITYVARTSSISGEDAFHAYVASDTSRDAVVLIEGPGWTSLDEALTWSRQHTDRVVLSYGVTGAGVFSAGPVYYGGEDARDPLPEWPPAASVVRRLDARARSADLPSGSSGATIGVEEPEVKSQDVV